MICSVSNSTYFYIIAILYFVIYNSKTYYKDILFWFTLLASLLIGTKSIYLAIILIGLVLTIRLVKKLKLKVIIASFFLLFSVALGYIFFSTDLFSEIIKQDAFGHIFNAVTPQHPSKSDYYTKKAIRLGLVPPSFAKEEEGEVFKQVDSELLDSVLKYNFKHSLT